MARKPNHQFEKRKREKAREERAAARRKRKEERASSGPATRSIAGEDPDLAGIIVGPQPKDEISKEEARNIVERAMNPGKMPDGSDARTVRSSRVFVGNLDFDTEEEELRQLFTAGGFKVQDAAVVRDRDTGQSRGFAFVEVEGLKEASRAVTQLDGSDVGGRSVRINIADRPPGRR